MHRQRVRPFFIPGAGLGRTMIRIQDLLDLIESIAPGRLAEEWDNCGLMVGDPSGPVQRAALALDATPETIRAAREADAQALITHHPLIFRPLKKLNLKEPTAEIIAMAIRWDLAVMAAHTNLDRTFGGVSWVLAHRLDLQEIEVLEPASPEDRSEGTGCIGTLKKPLKIKELLEIVKNKLKVPMLRVSSPPDTLINRVAVLGGSGGSFLKMAFFRGAQVLISGDFSYHQAREAEHLGICLIDAGHFSTERPILEKLAGRLSEAAAERGFDLEFQVLTGEREPWLVMED